MKSFMSLAILSIVLVSNTVSAQDVSLVVQITGETYEEKKASLEKMSQEVDELVDRAQKEAIVIQAEAEKVNAQLEQAEAAKTALEGDRKVLEKALIEAQEGSPLHALAKEKEVEYETAVNIVATDPTDENKEKKSAAQSAFLAASTAYSNAKAQVEQLKGALIERHKLAAGVDILAAIGSRVRELQSQIADLRTQIFQAEGEQTAKRLYVEALQKRAARVGRELEKLDREQLVALGMHNAQTLQSVLAESQKGNAKLDGIGKISMEMNAGIKEVNANLVSLQKQNLQMLTTLGTMKVQDESLAKELATLIKIVRDAVTKFPNDEKTQKTAEAVIKEAKKRVTAAASKPAAVQPAKQQAQPVSNPVVLNSSASYPPQPVQQALPQAVQQVVQGCIDVYGKPINCQQWYPSR